ncbi:MAG: MoxR family ATPase, partial [Lachnospiraceae bacterium]|nr:MoxR family ATPase [Lachnospiraceae bacterium]
PMYKKALDRFEYIPGAIMCNLFLADEINRTSPKTQSALLEVMEERRVTVDGVTREVPEPFIVMATQNPKGSAGTQLLPEAQLDRFMISMSMGYPDSEYEIEIAKNNIRVTDAEKIKPVISHERLAMLKEITDNIYMHDNIYKYIVRLNKATRESSYIELGISPRGTIALSKLSKARAFLQGRDYVIPEDVQAMYKDVGRHRIVLNTKARVSHVTEESILTQIMIQTKAPVSYME